MTIALYPGTFDPVTNGHADIATRAASLFDQLIVGVYDAPPKKLLFDTKDRVLLFSEAVKRVPNIKVVPYKGLTVHYAREIGAQVMVRGLRASSDFEFEFEMAMMNRKLVPEIEVVSLMTRLEYQFLSSSLLKEVCTLGGDIHNLVPHHVETALKAKLKV
ncbi:MAG: pantetheine-phosphate adenylyltransferase [Dehalococcoidia bacterium]|nr:pantetheine-phosphate adenylyltransferase [Dehalococcoidia bacterium]